MRVESAHSGMAHTAGTGRGKQTSLDVSILQPRSPWIFMETKDYDSLHSLALQCQHRCIGYLHNDLKMISEGDSQNHENLFPAFYWKAAMSIPLCIFCGTCTYSDSLSRYYRELLLAKPQGSSYLTLSESLPIPIQKEHRNTTVIPAP